VSAAGRAATPSARLASWLVVAFGALFALHSVIGRGQAVTGSGLSFAAVVLLTTSLCGYGLRRRSLWAWWASLLLAGLGLFFVLPVVGAILLGTTTEPVGTGWDVIFFPLTTAILIALLALLVMARRQAGTAGQGETPP